MITTKEVLTLAREAVDGDPAAINELFMAVNLRDGMKKIFNAKEGNEGPRNALIMVGKYYGMASVRELGTIFGVTNSHISQIIKKLQSNPQIKQK